MYDPSDTLRLDVQADDRQTLRNALDQSRGFLLVAGLDEEVDRVGRLRECVEEAAPDEPIVVEETTAVRGVASMAAYRNHLLDDDEVEAAAEVEQALRRLAEQDPVLEEVR